MNPNQTVVPPGPLSIPLPRFRQPISDPPLPEVTEEGTGGPSPAGPPTPAPDHRPPTSPDDGPLPPLVLSPDLHTRTGTFSRAGGDPKVAGEVVAGLIALACLWAFTLFGRRGYDFRQPTQHQVNDVATPLGAIAARYLPTEIITKDLVDATRAAAGTHRYVIDGPLLTRRNEPLPLPEDMQ